MPVLAHFCPDVIHTTMQNDPKHRAELVFLNLLKTQLPTGWHVYYHVSWLGKDRGNGSYFDGETDFVLTHPDMGILVAELKGGVIGFNAPHRTYTSTDRNGITHTITSPFAQASWGVRNLKGKMAELGHRDLPIFRSVIFPHCDRATTHLSMEDSPHMILGQNDLPEIANRLSAIFRAQWQGTLPGVTRFAQKALHDLLCRSTTLANPLKSQLAAGDAQIQALTNTQIDLFSRLKGTRRMAVTGGAGSGKTYVAVHRARELASQGMRTLLLCNSEPLAQWMKSLAAGQTNLEVHSAKDLAHAYAPSTLDTREYDHEGAAVALWEACEEGKGPAYDAVLIDEGQDFSKTWYDALEACLGDRTTGIFYVFHDSNNQVLRLDGSAVPDSLLNFQLEENIRNSQNICEKLTPFYAGTVNLLPRGPAGSKTDVVRYTDASEMRALVSSSLRQLIQIQRIDPRDIAVLTVRPTIGHSCLVGNALLHGYTLVRDAALVSKNTVLISTVDDFKGLERLAVLVVDIDEQVPIVDKLRHATFYVAFSRAKMLLKVFVKHGVTVAGMS
jgi:hypothetical protein